MTSSPSSFSRFCASALRSRPLLPAGEISVRTSSGEGLVRRLGVFDLILLGIGVSIGAGIFVITGTVAHDAGPGVTISFIIAGAACVLSALCYAELACRFPAVVGGAYLYTHSAFNEITAFLVFAQLMVDGHIGGAAVTRSLAAYLISIIELIPFFKGDIPSWIGHGYDVHGIISLNLLAPILLVLVTIVLCRGVRESSLVNSIMTLTKVIIVLCVIFFGAFEIDTTNWTPFAPNGTKSILTGATVVFFSYVGYDAVANCAEECKKPQRDMPIGMIVSLVVCITLYVAVCLVLTGMVPYQYIGEDAPLSEAFSSKGLNYVSVLISFGAAAGVTTSLLVGLYVQSRLYLGLARDGLLPAILAKVHPTRHTPVNSQVWIALVDIVLAGLLNVSMLSHIVSVGALTGSSVTSACVVTLRWHAKTSSQDSEESPSSKREEGILCIVAIACCGFATGIFYRFDASFIFLILAIVPAILAVAALYLRQVYITPKTFSCPGVPFVPCLSIFIYTFLAAQLHYAAWVRFVVVNIISIAIYALYGQYHSDPLNSNALVVYHTAPPGNAK